MKVITTKLKRYKTVCWILNILLFPIRLPVFALFKIGEVADKVLDFIDELAHKFMHKVDKTFKFEETAREQYKTNKSKFKEW
jgi:hypothetical protein